MRLPHSNPEEFCFETRDGFESYFVALVVVAAAPPAAVVVAVVLPAERLVAVVAGAIADEHEVLRSDQNLAASLGWSRLFLDQSCFRKYLPTKS